MSRWINVKDRRPKVQRGSHYFGVSGPISHQEIGRFPFLPVLFYARGEKSACAGRFFGRRRGYWSLQGKWYADRLVTHWQPMPDKPKGAQ